MSRDELSGEIWSLFNPEQDEDGFFPREFPHSRIVNHHKLEISYMNTWLWEGSTSHRYTRRCDENDKELHAIDRNMDVPLRLFEAGLRLFGDSIVKYHDLKERKGPLRFYPAIILTFWSGLEAFVKYASELMILTVRDVPEVVENYLREQEVLLDDKKTPKLVSRHHRVLDRYVVLLKYGYAFDVNKGDSYWQRLDTANKLRNYYTHLGIKESRSINSSEIVDFLEDVLMALITPSCKLQRSLLLHMYDLYETWAKLSEFSEAYTEQPFFHDKPFDKGYLFHCNFENVDAERFPNEKEFRKELADEETSN